METTFFKLNIMQITAHFMCAIPIGTCLYFIIEKYAIHLIAICSSIASMQFFHPCSLTVGNIMLSSVVSNLSSYID